MRRCLFYLNFLLLILINSPLSGQDLQGFFLDDFDVKNTTIPPYEDIDPSKSSPTVTVTVNSTDTISRVSIYIYGNNANVYMIQMITEPLLIRYIQQLSPHVLRYPGGNLSNQFFWNAFPGELPQDVPDTLYTGNRKRSREYYWFGKDSGAENMSVNNYYKTLEMTNCTGSICINYGYARYGTGPNPVQTAAKYAADWVRYDNGHTMFWEIGNENYGSWQAGYKIKPEENQDNQPEIITGELYGKHFKIFADSMRAAASKIGSNIKIGAVMFEMDEEWQSPVEKGWNSGVLKQAGNAADFFIIHSYFTPYKEDSSIPTILNSPQVGVTKRMNYVKQIVKESGIKMKPVALTEWNIFAKGSKQKVSYINGIHSVLVLGELIKNQYGMANRWNLANAWEEGDDWGIFSRGDEPSVPRWNPRPAFYYMTYFQRFFGDHMVSSTVSGDSDIVAYASLFNSREAGIIIVNKGGNDQLVCLKIDNFNYGERYYLYSLTGGDDNGDFSLRVYVNGHVPEYSAGGPADIDEIKAFSAVIDKEIIIHSPAHSVQYVLVEYNENNSQ
jgi:hypothetical protein